MTPTLILVIPDKSFRMADAELFASDPPLTVLARVWFPGSPCQVLVPASAPGSSLFPALGDKILARTGGISNNKRRQPGRTDQIQTGIPPLVQTVHLTILCSHFTVPYVLGAQRFVMYRTNICATATTFRSSPHSFHQGPLLGKGE